MNKIFLLSLMALTAPAIAQTDHSLPIDVIEVTAKKIDGPTDETLYSDAPLTSPIYDAGALLRSVNGMDAARRGGRGFEPIIRGQSQNQINVVSDGAYSFGACPGRMDPPSTYVGFDSFDKVSVIKGHRSVIYGAGGSGGTLLFEHQRPQFDAGSVKGNIIGASTSNSNLNSIAADLAAGNDKGFVRVFGEVLESDNYNDGDGNTVSSAFDSNGIGIISGMDIGTNDYLEASVERANKENIYYAGNQMDAPFADSESLRLRWLHDSELAFIDTVNINVYQNKVEHLMDNYSVRNRSPMPNGMAVPSSSDTWGGRILATTFTDYSEFRYGFDLRANDRNALMYSDVGKDGSYDMLGSIMWPAVEQRQMGIFGEWDYQLSNIDLLRLGLRFDDFTSKATSASESAGMMGAATLTNLYQNFYGTSVAENDSRDVGLVVGWDRILNQDLLLSINISRAARTPDATENFIARSAMGSAWVGNPNIETEIHQQVDFTLLSQGDSTNWSLTTFWDEVDNYIERYVLGNANLYRNIDASLRGIEAEISRDFGQYLSARVGLSYTRGEGDNGDLAQISPLQARFNLDYQRDVWALGAEIIAADNQSHFNPMVDVAEESQGFGIMNVYGHWQVGQSLTAEAGFENIFDRTYAYHVNVAAIDPFDPTAIRVNEPGRQAWLKLRYAF